MTKIDEKDLEKIAGGRTDPILLEMYNNMCFALDYAEDLIVKYKDDPSNYDVDVKYIKYEIIFGKNFFNNGDYEAAKEKARHNWQYMSKNTKHSEDNAVHWFMKYLKRAAECAGYK